MKKLCWCSVSFTTSMRNHLPILPLVSTLSKTPEVSFGKTAKYLMKLHLVVLLDLDLCQFCTINSGYSNGLKFNGKIVVWCKWAADIVNKNVVGAGSIWASKRCKWTFPENSYLFACEMLEQDRHNKQLLSFRLILPKVSEKQRGSYLSVLVVIICRVFWKSIGIIMKLVSPDLITLQVETPSFSINFMWYLIILWWDHKNQLLCSFWKLFIRNLKFTSRSEFPIFTIFQQCFLLSLKAQNVQLDIRVKRRKWS